MKTLERQFKFNKNCSDELLLILEENKGINNARNKFFERQYEINSFLRIASNKFDEYNSMVENSSYFNKKEFGNKTIDYYLSIKQILSIIDSRVESLCPEVQLKYFRKTVKELTKTKHQS